MVLVNGLAGGKQKKNNFNKKKSEIVGYLIRKIEESVIRKQHNSVTSLHAQAGGGGEIWQSKGL